MTTHSRLEGEGISLPMRVVHVAWLVGQESTNRSATEIAQRLRLRSGKALDPALAALAADDVDAFLAGLDDGDLNRPLSGM